MVRHRKARMTTTLPEATKPNLREKGIAFAKSGDLLSAKKYLQQAVQQAPQDERAWLYLAGLAETREEAVEALRCVEAVNPNSVPLRKAKIWVEQKWPLPVIRVPEIQPAPKPGRRKFWLIAGLAVAGMIIMLVSIFVLTKPVTASPLEAVAGVLFPTPTNTVAQEIDRLSQRLTQAESSAGLEDRIATLEEWVELAPDDTGLAEQLAEAYYEQGIILRNERNFEAAQTAFNHALAIQETMETALLENQQIDLYLEGVDYYQNGDWPQAIKALAEIYRQTPAYPNLNEILYSAYFNQGVAQQAMNQLEDAQQSFAQAAEILPDVPEAGQKAEEVALLLNPPTPTPFPNLPNPASAELGDKQVVVDISEQRAYTYLNDKLVNEFIISTGEPGRDTAVGSFEIQNKIPVAYASTWNLDMPYWLGIYYSGPLQNGFHAVPTVRSTGLTMWDGYLGQRVSYGCVILSLADAETLYDWVDIGTPVKIQW